MEIPESLRNQVIELVKTIPYGKVMSYGQIGSKLGVEDARLIGWTMHTLHDDVPWWRVVNNEGKITINDDALRLKQKELLAAEGISVTDDFALDIEKYRHGIVPGQKKLF